jgi:Icc protein
MRTLVHLSDTHILPTDADRLQGVDTLQNVRDVLEIVVDSGLRPDALVVSGDLANNGELESYRRLRGELDAVSGRPAPASDGTLESSRVHFRLALVRPRHASLS